MAIALTNSPCIILANHQMYAASHDATIYDASKREHVHSRRDKAVHHGTAAAVSAHATN